MAILDAYANHQYRPVSTVETGVDAPLSVRCYSDMASAINNYKLLVGAPRRGQPCFPYWETQDASTAAHVVAVLGPMYVPDGFNSITFDVCTRKSGDKVSSVAWTVYASSQHPYNGGVDAFSTLAFPWSSFNSAGVVTSSVEWKWASNDIDMVYTKENTINQVFFTVIAANGTSGSRAEMQYFGVRAYH